MGVGGEGGLERVIKGKENGGRRGDERKGKGREEKGWGTGGKR